MQHRLMIIGSSIENQYLVKLAKKRGYYTVVCDGYIDGPAKKFADKAYNVDIRDADAVAQICLDEKVDGIIGSFSDLIFEQITHIAAKAGLKWYAKPDMLKYYREKSVAKGLLKKLGVRVPNNCIVPENFSDRDLAGMTFPLVLKPTNGWGSRGIFVVHNMEEAHHFAHEVVKYAPSQHECVEVEEYSHGKEYNMMTWLENGKVNVLSIANREKNPQTGNAIPMLNRVAYPAKEIHEIISEAKSVLEKFSKAVGQTEGALSMQFFYNEHGVEVCEIAGRMFGYEHEMVTICSKLDVEKLLLDYVYETDDLRQSLLDHSPFFTKHCSGLYFMGYEGKRIKNLDRARKLAQRPSVADATFFYNDGEIINNHGSVPHLVRFYITGQSREEIDKETAYFFNEMKVEATDSSELVIPFVLEV